MDEINKITNKLEVLALGDCKINSNRSEMKKVLDHVKSQSKGAPRSGKNNGKKGCCSNCGLVGHTKRTCRDSVNVELDVSDAEGSAGMMPLHGGTEEDHNVPSTSLIWGMYECES